ncbi:MAG: HigA family addiction module antitoxin [Bryobacteraceae bacterium]
MAKRLIATHPGEILREELEERGISLNRLSRDIRVPLSRISMIVNGKRAMTPDTALRLERYFGAEAQFWMNLQTQYDLGIASQSAAQIKREVIPADRNAA